jgi:hypothetical protein
MINAFHEAWGTARAFVLTQFVVAALYFGWSEARAHVIDGLEYVGPGSEASRTEHEARDKQNERAYEKDRDNAPNRNDREKQQDRERAAEYTRDHLS